METRLVSGMDKLQRAINDAATMHSQMSSCFTDLVAIANVCVKALKDGRTLLFCGNGGSAAEAQHIATEFVVRLTAKRNRRALSALALTTDTSLLTASGNDLGFEKIFARQVEAHMHDGDVLILLSTSGASPNLLEAALEARARGGTIVAFLGKDSTPLDEFAHHSLHVPSHSSQRVQEAHLLCGHMLVELVEDLLIQHWSPEDGEQRPDAPAQVVS